MISFLLVTTILSAALRIINTQAMPNDSEACLSHGHTVISETTRFYQYNQTLNGCDSNMTPGWYKFEGADGSPVEIPRTCLKNGLCGTQLPMRLDLHNQSLPDPNVTVWAHVCTSYDILGKWDCCVLRQRAGIRNCGTFYVYHLLPTDRCDVGYCIQEAGTIPSKEYLAKTGDPVMVGQDVDTTTTPSTHHSNFITTLPVSSNIRSCPGTPAFECHHGTNRICHNTTSGQYEVECRQGTGCGIPCNNVPECEDDSDEDEDICPPPVICSEGRTQCPDERKCYIVCDGVQDCDSGYDERDCVEATDTTRIITSQILSSFSSLVSSFSSTVTSFTSTASFGQPVLSTVTAAGMNTSMEDKLSPTPSSHMTSLPSDALATSSIFITTISETGTPVTPSLSTSIEDHSPAPVNFDAASQTQAIFTVGSQSIAASIQRQILSSEILPGYISVSIPVTRATVNSSSSSEASTFTSTQSSATEISSLSSVRSTLLPSLTMPTDVSLLPSVSSLRAVPISTTTAVSAVPSISVGNATGTIITGPIILTFDIIGTAYRDAQVKIQEPTFDEILQRAIADVLNQYSNRERRAVQNFTDEHVQITHLVMGGENVSVSITVNSTKDGEDFISVQELEQIFRNQSAIESLCLQIFGDKATGSTHLSVAPTVPLPQPSSLSESDFSSVSYSERSASSILSSTFTPGMLSQAESGLSSALDSEHSVSGMMSSGGMSSTHPLTESEVSSISDLEQSMSSILQTPTPVVTPLPSRTTAQGLLLSTTSGRLSFSSSTSSGISETDETISANTSETEMPVSSTYFPAESRPLVTEIRPKLVSSETVFLSSNISADDLYTRTSINTTTHIPSETPVISEQSVVKYTSSQSRIFQTTTLSLPLVSVTPTITESTPPRSSPSTQETAVSRQHALFTSWRESLRVSVRDHAELAETLSSIQISESSIQSLTSVKHLVLESPFSSVETSSDRVEITPSSPPTQADLQKTSPETILISPSQPIIETSYSSIVTEETTRVSALITPSSVFLTKPSYTVTSTFVLTSEELTLHTSTVPTPVTEIATSASNTWETVRATSEVSPPETPTQTPSHTESTQIFPSVTTSLIITRAGPATTSLEMFIVPTIETNVTYIVREKRPLFEENIGLFIFLIVAGACILGACVVVLVAKLYRRRRYSWDPRLAYQDAYADMEKSNLSFNRDVLGVESPIPDIDILKGENDQETSLSKASTMTLPRTPKNEESQTDKTVEPGPSFEPDLTIQSAITASRVMTPDSGHANQGFETDTDSGVDGIVPVDEIDSKDPRRSFPWMDQLADTRL